LEKQPSKCGKNFVDSAPIAFKRREKPRAEAALSHRLGAHREWYNEVTFQAYYTRVGKLLPLIVMQAS
jgi:hypothetical protein